MAAKVYAAPSSIVEPRWSNPDSPGNGYDREWYDQENERYEADIKTWLLSQGWTGPYAGELIHFPVADGSADYMVAKLRPLTLIHMNWGDAWNADRILMNGLTAADVKERVDGNRRLQALFAKRSNA